MYVTYANVPQEKRNFQCGTFVPAETKGQEQRPDF